MAQLKWILEQKWRIYGVILVNAVWLGEIWHHGQYRSMNFPYANMMLNQLMVRSDESR